MVSPARKLYLAAAFVLLLSVGATALDEQLPERLRDYLRPFVESGNFTGAVLVAQRGKVVLREAYGMANYEWKIANTPETRFHIASVSKPFTAAAILQLQEQGKLQITDRLSRFIPDFPHGRQITLENLLTHTSGIPNINDLPDYDTFARNPHSLTELVAKFASLPLEFEPGSDYHYSNSNYNLLALVIEKASGEDYASYIRRHILQPAGMRDSGIDSNALELIPFAAAGYQPAGVSGYEKAPYIDWSNKTGNGSLYSTVDDLYRFDRALNADIILQAPTRHKYFVAGRGNRFGWFLRKRLGHRVMSSNGRSPGFTAELDRYPDDDVTIIVLSNSYATVSQDPIAEALAAILFGSQPPPVPAMRAAPVAPATLASYVGPYQFGADYFVPNAVAELSASAGYMTMQVGSFRTPLVPLSPTEFLERNFFGHVLLSATPNGHKLTYRYAGRDYVAVRIQSGTPKPN